MGDERAGPAAAPILVTGGAGFIGSALVRRLIEERIPVVSLDRLTYAAHPDSLGDVLASPLHTLLRTDVCDRRAVRAALDRHRPTAVVHLAAESHVDRSIDEPADFVRTNLVGTFTLLEETFDHWSGLAPQARDRFRFVHVSTDEVFGSATEGERFRETSPYDPSSPYSASKAGADHLARAWHRTYGLPVLVTGATNNYGPRQFPEKLIPRMIVAALEGDELPVYGDGRNVRDWLHVDDHVDGLLAALHSGEPGERYLFGGECERANVDVVEAICDLVDEMAPSLGRPRRELIRFVADRPGHDRRYAVDPSRAHSALGWRAGRAFEDGLRSTVRWYLDNRPWWESIRSGEYRSRWP